MNGSVRVALAVVLALLVIGTATTSYYAAPGKTQTKTETQTQTQTSVSTSVSVSTLTYTVTTTPSTSGFANGYSCIISGSPGPLWLAVLGDNSTKPVADANVAVTGEEPYCPPSGTGVESFTTSSKTFWYSVPEGDYGAYLISVSFSGHVYNLTAAVSPLSETCAILYLPSGLSNVTIDGFKQTCPY
jgi:hypothetical protein